jgi:multiple RNA-binding domain-containing protein 1
MSRLIIKNLPSYVTPVRLQEHFEGKTSDGPGGTLTDVKVAMKPDGTSRRFGFVGYKTDKEAAAAKAWFDKTFIDSTRISVAVVEVRMCFLFLLLLLRLHLNILSWWNPGHKRCTSASSE